jgi:hypothetical protein
MSFPLWCIVLGVVAWVAAYLLRACLPRVGSCLLRSSIRPAADDPQQTVTHRLQPLEHDIECPLATYQEARYPPI